MLKRSLLIFLIDSFSVIFSLIFSFLIRFDFQIPHEYFQYISRWILIFCLTQFLVFYGSGLQERIWRFTSIFDLIAILKSNIISIALSLAILLFLDGFVGYPRSVLLLYGVLNIILISSTRIVARIYHSHLNKSLSNNSKKTKRKLILIGAGSAGEKIAREILNSSSFPYRLVGFVDDDKNKIGQRIHGLKVLCSISDLPNLKINFDEMLISIPSGSRNQIRKILFICKKVNKRYKIIPSLVDSIDKESYIETVRDVSYVDLLGREEVKLDMDSIDNLLYNKRILVTGAGGSIGSELVKQCMKFQPSEVICIDNNEEKIFNIEVLSNLNNSNIVIKTSLVDIKNKNELKKVFNDHRPQIIFHAAAYKHVPIQENHPWTSVSTNIGGTLNLVKLSDFYKVEKFVFVSTDKAVNPTNIMGASKRICERMLESFNEISDTNYMAVRFGNVLGSSGSAIPIFEKQIKNGGPITITHPEITRYFMSIQEASQLIIQCSAIGDGGQILLLEMGKPIKILQMARDLIRLSGLEPDKDIPIVFSGLRPGEKLYEELQLKGEQKVNTKHKKIMILTGVEPAEPWIYFKSRIENLLRISKELNYEKIQKSLKELLPTYEPSTLSNYKNKDFNSFEKVKAQA